MQPIPPRSLLFLFGFLILSHTACSPRFDQVSLDNISNIGTKITGLMQKATGDFSSNSSAATALLSDINKAYEHAKSIKGNKEIAESWRILKDELVAPFLDKWKNDGKLDKDFIKEAVAQVTKSINAITTAEKAKRK